MDLDINKSNSVEIGGEILNKPEYTHELYGEGFFEFSLGINRLSGYQDKIPITISEKLFNEDEFKIGKQVAIKGQLRSYNKMIEGKSKLILTVFAREIIEFNEEINPNIIEISGYICKEPIYRTTPFNREICDLLLAVNRAFNKSDYLPCIAWGRNARFIKECKVGERIFISGRIQSRDYQKKLPDGSQETRTAYEVSVNKVNLDKQNFDLINDEVEDEEEKEAK